MDNNMREIDTGTPKASVDTKSLLAPRSLLSQVVETQLLPPERFKGDQNAEVVDIRSIGETVTCLRQIGGHYEAVVYGGRGNPNKIALDPSSSDVLEQTGKRYVNTSTSHVTNQHADSPVEMLKKLGIESRQAEELAKVWSSEGGKRWGSDTYVEISRAKQGVPFYLSLGHWNVETRTNMNGQKVFLFNVGNSHFVVSPEEPSKKIPLSSQEFEALQDSENTLPGDLKLKKEQTIFGVTDKDGKVLASYTGTDPILEPSATQEVYFINTGRVYKLDLSGVANRTSKPVLEQQLQVEDPKEIEFDPSGNFLLVRSGDGKLSVVDKETGDIVKDFDDVKGPFKVDAQGDVLYVDLQGRLREIQTNFQAIPAGGTEAAQKRRVEELRQMQERFASLELKKVERQRGGQISEADVAKTLRETISRQVTEQITTATNPADVEDVLDRLQGLKSDPSNQAYGEVIDEFVNQAREKLSGIRTAEFDTQLGTYQKALDEVKSVGDTIGLDEQFAKLLELRQKIDVTDPQKRREIEQRLRTIQGSKDAINNQYQGELVNAARETLPEIEQLVKETGSTQELGYLSTSTQAQQFEMMLANIRDPQVRKELRDKYTAVRTEQRTRLEENSRQLGEQDRLRWAQIVNEAKDDLATLREQIEQLSDTREIDRFGRNPLATAWRAKLYSLPPELREIEEKKLEIILGARKKDMEHRRELGAVGEAGELKFGNATFPVYKEPPRIWQAKLTPRKTGFSNLADLTFEDMQGKSWRPEGENDVVVNNDLSDERTKGQIDRYRKEADEYFSRIKRKVPDFDYDHWRITDFHMGKLEEIAEALNLQIVNHRGILILQGEAGTGKNVLVDMLANLSNREVIQIACNENSVKEDLTYEWKYDPKKGTYEIPSRLIKGIQVPGTIILLDEINALKPGIAKMLNSLFDYRRRIYLPGGEQEQEVITDPTVLFVATMNPQNYGGVNRLSPEVKSRARVVDIDYPPFEEMRGGRTHYRSDEAEMLAGYMEKLGTLKQQEFKQVWNYVINRDTTNGADRILQGDPEIETDTRRVYDVIRVANRLRAMYEAFQIGDSNEPMEFPTSFREVTDIVMEMNHRQGVKPIIKRVIIPKIDDRKQKRIVEQTIDAVLPS